MNKNEVQRLQKYLTMVQDRLASPVPAKHLGGEAEFRAFLNNEIRMTKLKLDKLEAK